MSRQGIWVTLDFLEQNSQITCSMSRLKVLDNSLELVYLTLSLVVHINSKPWFAEVRIHENVILACSALLVTILWCTNRWRQLACSLRLSFNQHLDLELHRVSNQRKIWTELLPWERITYLPNSFSLLLEFEQHLWATKWWALFILEQAVLLKVKAELYQNRKQCTQQDHRESRIV